jgi:hypothetical protein
VNLTQLILESGDFDIMAIKARFSLLRREYKDLFEVFTEARSFLNQTGYDFCDISLFSRVESLDGISNSVTQVLGRSLLEIVAT